MSKAPDYKISVRGLFALKNLLQAWHAYSRAPHQVARRELDERRHAAEAILREAGEQIHAQPKDEPLLFPTEERGRR